MLKTQVKTHSKIDNSVKNQKFKTYMSNLSKDLKETRCTMLDIIIQTRLLPLLNVIIKIVGTRVSNLSRFLV